MNKHAKMKPFFRASLGNAGGSGVLEMMVYEQIGENWWDGSGVTAKNFKAEIDAAGGAYSRIALRINSPGGDAFEGVAILNMLRAQGKPIDVFVDGLAASAASIIAMAGDSITMGSGAMMMIHNAWGGTVGNAADHQKQVNALTAIDASIAQVYADRTGIKATDAKAMMDAETWMGADECVEKGFATGKAADQDTRGALNMARGFKALAHFAKTPDQFKSAAGAECECECRACMGGDCANCSNAGCVDANCKDCPMQSAKAKAGRLDPVYAGIEEERFLIRSMVLSGHESRGSEHAFKDGRILAIRRAGSTALNLASAGDGKPAVARVTGLLAPYGPASGDLGGFVEVYQKGCFDEFLKSDDPRVLFNHDVNHVLGRKSAGTARFWEEADGLHYDADLPDTQCGRDLRVSMERKDIRESSAAFYIYAHRWENRSGVRTRVVEKARLVEGSPHSFAAYEDSTATPAETPQASADHELEHLGARLQLLRIA